MVVHIRLFAALRERAGRDSLELELPEGARVADALAAVDDLAGGLSLVLAVNREYAEEDQALHAGDHVAISTRPEDVELSEVRPSGDNVWEGRVAQKVFLGEALDFQVTVGPRTLLSRQHPTLRTKVGEPIFVRLNPEKCVVLKIA